MKLIYRLVFAELIGPFIFGVMAFTSVMFAGSQLLKITNWLLGGTINVGMALEMIALTLPSIIVFTLPMSTLLAVLLGIGRLSGDSEVVALFAGGTSFYRIAIPVLILGIVVSGGAIALNEVVVPWAYTRLADIQAVIAQEVAPNDRAFTVYDDKLDMQIVAKGGLDPDSGILRNVSITWYADSNKVVNGVNVVKNQPIAMMYADRAEWEGLKDSNKRYKWKLYDGFSQQLGTDSSSSSSFAKSKTDERDLGKTPTEFALYQKTNLKNTDQLSFHDLSRIVTYLNRNPDRPLDQIREFDVNRWNKLALPFSSMVFALLAAPMGIRPSRSGSSVGFGLSIGLILIYWIVWHFTSHLAIQGNLTPMAGAFAADVLGIVVAAMLIRRVTK